MKINTLDDIRNIEGKKVLLRVDFNVPLKKNGEIQDDSRIQAALPTIKFLQKNEAKIILITHLGRPGGEYKQELKLDKIAKHLHKTTGIKVIKTDTILGIEVCEAIKKMKEGEIVMLENIRFRPEEKVCDGKFTEELANLGDIFVNDAFGTAHRKHTSTWGLAKHLPSYAGRLMEKEIKSLSPLLEKEVSPPLTMIFGGAKIDTKIGVIQNFIKKANYFLIGGGLANTFLHAEGKDIGESLCETDKTDIAKNIMTSAKPGMLQLPNDVVVAKEISENTDAKTVSTEQVSGNMKILDIGPKTAEKYAKIIDKSGTVIWNGPLGLYELKPFQNGSKTIAESIAKSDCTSIVGGGDTADCIKRFDLKKDNFTHISTGGGACIEFLSGKELPGIEILRKK